MTEPVELFTIVPKNDNYHWLARAENYSHYLVSKENGRDECLLFESEMLAAHYISEILKDSENYLPQHYLVAPDAIDMDRVIIAIYTAIITKGAESK